MVDYTRGFCRQLPDWPLGDLNLPRALFTEKAFPENEVVLTSAIALRGPGSVMNELIYEKRLGARSMIEVAAPFGFLNLAEPSNGTSGTAPVGWTAGIGDLGAAFKHAVVHSARTGSIVSLGLDVSVPTGRADRGLGAGVTVVGPFVACGQLLPAGGFVQAHAGADLPADFDTANPEVFWRAVVGWSLVPRRFGRMYSPMIEVLGARELGPSDAVVIWDVAPQIQVTLNRRKHIRLERRRPRSGEPDRGPPRAARDVSALGLVRGEPPQRLVEDAPSQRCLRRRAGDRRCRDDVAAAPAPAGAPSPPLFATSDKCLACHNGMTTPVGGRRLDRVRLAGVDDGQRGPRSVLASRRPTARPSTTLPPRRSSRTSAPRATCRWRASKRTSPDGSWRSSPVSAAGRAAAAATRLALDGVSCALCHQLQNAGSGARAQRRIRIDTSRPWGERLVFGPYDIPPARARVMHSATGFLPARATNLKQSEMCSTCHTLYTTPLGAGKAGDKPRRVSPSRCHTWNGGPAPTSARESCQACHMTFTAEPDACGQRARRAARAVRAPRIPGRELLHAGDAGKVPRRAGRRGAAPGAEPVAAADAGASATSAATLSIARGRVARRRASRSRSSSPTRRAQAPDRVPVASRLAPRRGQRRRGAAAVLLGSAAPRRQHRGNDNDRDPLTFEPHRLVIEAPDQVQITNRSWRTRAGA